MENAGYMIFVSRGLYFYCNKCEQRFWMSLKDYQGKPVYADQLGSFQLPCAECHREINPSASDVAGPLFEPRSPFPVSINRLNEVLAPGFTLD